MAKTNLQLKITLAEVEPPIWRRVVVPADLTLAKLHDVLQVVMGWTNSHLHMFEVDGTSYGVPDPELECKDERKVRLSDVANAGEKLVYRYDFGDDWEHRVVVEELVEGSATPICIDGKRACPPEDVGGAWSYPDFLKAWKNPKHPEHGDMREWVGPDFDPERFDLREINARLATLAGKPKQAKAKSKKPGKKAAASRTRAN